MERTEDERQRINAFMEEYIQLQLKHGIMLWPDREMGEMMISTREELMNMSHRKGQEFNEARLRFELNAMTGDDWKDPKA